MIEVVLLEFYLILSHDWKTLNRFHPGGYAGILELYCVLIVDQFMILGADAACKRGRQVIHPHDAEHVLDLIVHGDIRNRILSPSDENIGRNALPSKSIGAARTHLLVFVHL